MVAGINIEILDIIGVNENVREDERLRNRLWLRELI
jgi:hypothetical protein